MYSWFILPLLQVHLEQIDLVWRILLVGTDGFSSRSVDVYLIPLSVYCTLNLWYYNNYF
jgi:hypothetical protein